MSAKEQMRKRINELFTTGKLKGVKDLATLFLYVESRESFEKKPVLKARKNKTSNSQQAHEVWIPHLKIVRKFFSSLGEENVTKFKFSEPHGCTKRERDLFVAVYDAGIQDMTAKLTIPDEKVREKRKCHSRHSFPYHLVKWTYVNANGRKYKCDMILLKSDLYVTLYTSNGAYYELREEKPKGGFCDRKFENIGYSLQRCYTSIPRFICGDSLGRSIMFFDGNDMEKDVGEKFVNAQTRIQEFYWFCSEAIRFSMIIDEIRQIFSADDWATSKPISEANRVYIRKWGKMSYALRGDTDTLSRLINDKVVADFDEMEKVLEVL